MIRSGDRLENPVTHPYRPSASRCSKDCLVYAPARRSSSRKPGDVVLVPPGTPHRFFRNRQSEAGQAGLSVRNSPAVPPLSLSGWLDQRDSFAFCSAHDFLVEGGDGGVGVSGGRQAVGIREADRVRAPDARSLDPNRVAGPVDLNAERGDRLSRRPKPITVGSGSHKHLGEVDDADQPGVVPSLPVEEEPAGLGVVGVGVVERANQDVGVEDDPHRSASSRSSRSR